MKKCKTCGAADYGKIDGHDCAETPIELAQLRAENEKLKIMNKMLDAENDRLGSAEWADKIVENAQEMEELYGTISALRAQLAEAEGNS